MILLFGTRAYKAMLLAVTLVCGLCGVRAEQRVLKRVNKLTVFFVPLFSLSTTHFLECQHCGRTTALSRQQVEHAADWAGSRA